MNYKLLGGPTSSMLAELRGSSGAPPISSASRSLSGKDTKPTDEILSARVEHGLGMLAGQ